MKLLLAASSFLLLSGACRAAPEPPAFDYAQTCQATPAVGMTRAETFSACMTDEHSAREALPAIWRVAKPHQRRACSLLTKMGGLPSYVELVTCLEMEQALNARPPATRDDIRMRITGVSGND